MKLILAPMEGVMDFTMRDYITRQNHPLYGGYDQAVTEFIRVTDLVLPAATFYKYCPELKNNSKTFAGVPVFIQLLGGNAKLLGENAKKACDLGAIGIDLNFGCPAPTVNRHDGGATLLKYPDRILDIVKTVRASVPESIPVSAKIRLGFDDPSACLLNAKRIEEGGASWVTVHCRTKTDLYKPPAYWEWIQKIRTGVQIPVVVNGEIWTLEDLRQCQEISEENQFMIGRGSLVDPFLAAKAKHSLTHQLRPLMSEEVQLERLTDLLIDFCQFTIEQKGPQAAARRMKQWLRFISSKNSAWKPIFDQIKLCENANDIYDIIKRRDISYTETTLKRGIHV